MDKIKIIMASIICMLCTAGAFAAAYDYNARITIEDKAWHDYTTKTGKSASDIDSIIQSAINKEVYGNQLNDKSIEIGNLADAIVQTNDIVKMDDAIKCLQPIANSMGVAG